MLPGWENDRVGVGGKEDLALWVGWMGGWMGHFLSTPPQAEGEQGIAA